jgi:hypothetical protein
LEGAYSLQRYTDQLHSKWAVELPVTAQEEPIDLRQQDENLLHLFSVIHKPKQKTAMLKAYSYNLGTGEIKASKILDSTGVMAWKDTANKAVVKEKIENLFCEYSRPSFTYQHDYRYEISYSPQGDKMLAYLYEYGHNQLKVRYLIFDKKLNTLASGVLPIDELQVIYDFYLSDQAEIIWPSVQKNTGALVLWKHVPASKKTSKNEFPFSQYTRDDLKLCWLPNKKVGVVHQMLDASENMAGIGFVTFDLATLAQETFGANTLSDEFRYYADSLRTAEKIANGSSESWKHFELVKVQPLAQGKTAIMLEKREFYESTYGYAGLKNRRKTRYDAPETKLLLRTEALWCMMFDAQQNLLWQQYLPKYQNTSANDGLQSVSFEMQWNANSADILFASSKAVGSPLQYINLWEMDLQNGQILSKKQLPNPDKISLLRSYTQFLPNGKIVVAGRKGLIGNNSMMIKYAK